MSRGRPNKYTDAELKEVLIEYAANNKGKINPLKLEKETGIKRHVWTRRMSEEINKLNENPLSIETLSDEKIPIPNLTDMVLSNINNKAELIRILNGYDLLIQELTEKSIHQDKLSTKNEELSSTIKELQEELNFVKKERNHYKNEYTKIAVESTYNHKREEKSINNVVDMNKVANKNKATSTNWAANFPSLFSDEEGGN